MSNYEKNELKYLEILSERFPTVQSVCTEIINLEAILNLPKGTEHFLSDLHGEYESFLHILKNASGVIKTKIDDIFKNDMTQSERRRFATLIYYPKEKLELIKKETANLGEFYRITLFRLIKICKVVGSKYSRSKVRKAIPKDYQYIINELLHSSQDTFDKESYYDKIIDSIISLGRADAFIITISYLIQQLAVDHMHIIGDIYDRGPGPDIIIDELMKYHSIDIEWGNHDIIWMGAAAGSEACIFNVIRICARYNNLDILEEGYGINIRTITEFAMEEYGDKNSVIFKPKNVDEKNSQFDQIIMEKTQQAAAIIQFKLEGAIIKKHPEYEMDDRLLLDKINYKKGKIYINGKTYDLVEDYFPTINPNNPYELSMKEKDVVKKLVKSFKNSEKLQRHIQFLYSKGNIYKVFNDNLLIHGCVPMDSAGEFVKVNINGKELKGKEYLDYVEKIARQGYFEPEGSEKRENGKDFLWYLWCGKNSPIFCKDKMKTFERYYLNDKETWEEIKNPFYNFENDENISIKVLEEFGIDSTKGHIICGHIPVKFKAGESPIKANGKLFIIDGGLSKAYQRTTGIAGYTLRYSSYGLTLVAHEPFTSRENAIINETDLHSERQIVEKVERKLIKDTDKGKELKDQIADLEKLLDAYKNGSISEKYI